jgi:hypothetical protein
VAESKASARRVHVALRRGEALKMRAAGATYDQIWEAFPDEYRSRAAVIQDVQRALMSVVAEGAADLRALEAARLDLLWTKAMEVLQARHITVSHGRVVYLGDGAREDGESRTDWARRRLEHFLTGAGDEDDDGPRDGEPLIDHGPTLSAIRELRALSESRRKLFGLDAPAQVQVMNDDALDLEIRRLTEELNRAAATEAATAEDATQT